MFLNFVCKRCNNLFSRNENREKVQTSNLCDKCLSDEINERELRKNYNLIKKRMFG